MATETNLPAVLLVETDLPTAELYRRTLSSDCDVLLSQSEAEALAIVADAALDAAVVEPAGLGVEGWAMVATLVQRRIPVIVCSTLDERKKGQELGVSRYLVKPVLAGTLMEVLRDIL